MSKYLLYSLLPFLLIPGELCLGEGLGKYETERTEILCEGSHAIVSHQNYKMMDKLHRIDQLIRLKATGQPHELARRLRVSPSTVYEYMDIMKKVLAAPIRYCHISRSYVYDEKGKLFLGFKHNQQTDKLR